MGKQVSMLLTPTLEECVVAAVKSGMPAREGEKLFCHYELAGWRYGKGKVPISNLSLVVSGWKLRWEERGRPDVNGHRAPDPSNGAVIVKNQKELERVEARMKSLRETVESHMDGMRAGNRAEFTKLKTRRDELRKLLGVMI